MAKKCYYAELKGKQTAMGLAASQARFLAITARKANCEFKSMQIAQEKLSVTRELDAATEEYQNALNATKLVWDPDGSGENVFDLDYDIMMRPSAVNDYSPYLISTRDGRIVLDNKMAAAARAAGIPETGCEPTDEMFTNFINQMVKTGGMSASAATSVQKLGLLKDVGIGAPLMDKTQASSMTLNDLLAYIEVSIANGTGGTPAEKELAESLTFNYGRFDENGNQLLEFETVIKDKGKANSNYFSINGQNKGVNDLTFDLADLLTDDITYARTGEKNPSGWKRFLSAICSIGSLGIANLVTGKGLTSLFGSGGSLETDKSFTEEDKAILDFVNNLANSYLSILDINLEDENQVQAFEYAIKETIALLSESKDLGRRSHSTDAFKDAVKESNNNNCWVKKDAKSGSNYGTTAISLSNLAESMLTFYAQAMNGYDKTYYIQDSSDLSSYVTDDPTYLYNIKNPNANTAEEIYIAEFYSAMFNNLCQNGWAENERIDENDYLMNSLKNAQYFITSTGYDNYFYQKRYMENNYVVEVTDDDAIKQAELAYTQKRSKLNYKEEKLEVDMKKLDLEISSLTTEYDTVKNLINTNVEKTFTMFN